MLFVGPPGMGKTMLASLVAVEIQATGSSVMFYPMAGFIKQQLRLMTLNDAWKKQDDPTAYSEWQKLDDHFKRLRNRTALVVLDDVGKEHSTATRYAEEEVEYLLRFRYDRGLPTILTSNLPVATWAGRYSVGMESFLHEACEIIPMEGQDHRKRRGDGD